MPPTAAEQRERYPKKELDTWASVIVNYNTRDRSKVIARTGVRRENLTPNAKKLKENET